MIDEAAKVISKALGDLTRERDQARAEVRRLRDVLTKIATSPVAGMAAKAWAEEALADPAPVVAPGTEGSTDG